MKRQTVKLGLAVCLLAAAFLAAGCGKTAGDSGRSSMGVDNEIAGFLFNFDQRVETGGMVKDNKQGKMPVRMSWYYESDPSVRVTEEDIQKNIQTSTEPELIADVYYALSNTIVLGIATNQTNTFIQYFIEFELESGDSVRFNFVTENTIRLGDQNYVVETDGSLWKAL